jgi:hypothetical protein
LLLSLSAGSFAADLAAGQRAIGARLGRWVVCRAMERSLVDVLVVEGRS